MLIHPLADSFHSALHTVQLLARSFDHPLERPPAIRLARAALREIVRRDPMPAENLMAAIKAIEADLARLSESRRFEYALAGHIDRALARAQLLVSSWPNAIAEQRRW